MTRHKSIFESAEGRRPTELEQQERQLALEYLAEAWTIATDEGVDQVALAHASLFAAVATLVRLHGDEAAADLVGELPERIRCGEYNLDRQLQ
jgi:hypothetical protein